MPSSRTNTKIILDLLNKNFVYDSLQWTGDVSKCATFGSFDDLHFVEIDGINGEVENIMCNLQVMLTLKGFDWFHQTDMEMISKMKQWDLMLEFSCTRARNDELKLKITLVHGENEKLVKIADEVKKMITIH